jgi:hypothetical protein
MIESVMEKIQRLHAKIDDGMEVAREDARWALDMLSFFRSIAHRDRKWIEMVAYEIGVPNDIDASLAADVVRKLKEKK